MNEGKTSALFAAVAVVCLGLAWWSRPDAITNESQLKDEVTGQPVFAKFEDPSEAASFQIVKYDETLGQLERFEVAKDKTSHMWKLPSYDDYPADAAEQVRDATTPLISMPILNVVSLDRGDHALYGVVNPDDDSMSVGESGVGMLVRVKSDSNSVLAELVIGKEVEGAEGQRYVRVPTEDATYVVELDTTPFTTDFQKWINQQLLEVRGFDIASIDLRDYAILPTQNGYGMSRNFDADLTFDSAKNAWSLDRMISYEQGKAVEVELGEDEKLQDKVLNDLRNAVQDLQIVNVRRKPTGLAADLKADKSLMENKESLQSLLSQGFIPQEGPDGTEIFATGGETLVGTAAGVKYLLRFGESVANLSSAVSEDGEESSGLRRYLLVSAVLDESKFPPPDLEPLPETVADMLARKQAQAAESSPPAAPPAEAAPAPANEAPSDDAGKADAAEPASSSDKASGDKADAEAEAEADAEAEAEADADATATATATERQPEPATEKQNADEPSEPPAAEPQANETPADSPAPEDDSPEPSAADDAAEAKPDSAPLGRMRVYPVAFQADPADDAATGDEPPAESADAQPAKADAEVDADVDAQADAEAAAQAAAEPEQAAKATPSASSSAEEPAAEEPAAEEPAKSDEELQEELEFVREQIAKENQRKIDARKEKMESARKRVQELNARFADWYYVVSDEVYKKLKVSRDELIGPATPESAPASESSGMNLPEGFQLPPGFQGQ